MLPALEGSTVRPAHGRSGGESPWECSTDGRLDRAARLESRLPNDLALCGSGGVSLLLQNEDGTFADVTARAYTGTFPTYDCVSAWPADIEMDGDLDLVVGVREGAPVVLRNNGNGTWQAQQPFAGTFNARAFAWADLDRDADPDAVFVDASGNLHIYINRQNGMFARVADLAGPTNVVSVAVADIDADGAIDVVTLDTMGVVRITSKPARCGSRARSRDGMVLPAPRREAIA
jgi:hypothetical protein